MQAEKGMGDATGKKVAFAINTVLFIFTISCSASELRLTVSSWWSHILTPIIWWTQPIRLLPLLLSHRTRSTNTIKPPQGYISYLSNLIGVNTLWTAISIFFFFVIYCNVGGSRVWNPVLWNVRYRTVVFCADVVIAKVSFLLTSPAPHISLPVSPCVPPSHWVLLTLAPPQHWPRGVSSLPPSIRFTLAGSMTQQLGKICPVFRLLTYMATVRLSVLLHWRDLDHLTT